MTPRLSWCSAVAAVVGTTTSGRVPRSGPGTVAPRVGVWSGGRASEAEVMVRPVRSVTTRSVGGSGDGDAAAVMQPVVVRTQQNQIVQFGGAAVFPVPEVVSVQAAGRPRSPGPRSSGPGAPARGAAAGGPCGCCGRRRSGGRRGGTTPRRWRHRSGIAGRRPTAAAPDAARRAGPSHRRARPRWCAARAARRAASASQLVSTSRINASAVPGHRRPPRRGGRRRGGRVSTARPARRGAKPARRRTPRPAHGVARSRQ